jgi:hypothetical protein
MNTSSKATNQNETVSDVATKETVLLLFSLVGAVAGVWVVRWASQPDMTRSLKMRYALQVKRYAQRMGEFWYNVAGKAATVYNREKW